MCMMVSLHFCLLVEFSVGFILQLYFVFELTRSVEIAVAWNGACAQQIGVFVSLLVGLSRLLDG